jgi:hypothetical protein
MPVAAAVPVTVANAVPMPPVQVAVANQAAMAVVMPMAVAAVVHLRQQAAFGHCGFGNGGLRRDGCRGGRTKQRGHSNDGCCQGHLRQHGYTFPCLASSGVPDPQPIVHPDPELNCNGRFIRHSRPHPQRAAVSWRSQEFSAEPADSRAVAVLCLDTPREHPHLNKP